MSGRRKIAFSRRLLLPLLLTISASLQAQPGTSTPSTLGTLLYSPTERQHITAHRQEGGSSATASGPARGVGAGNTLSLQGLVKRERQLGTVWLNQAALQEGQPLPLSGVPALRKRDIVVSGEPIRVGETLDTETATRRDFVPPNTVKVREQKQ
jgi:hypothetical protein